MNADSMKVQFTFQDWKWLSQTTKFGDEVNDPLMLTGQSEGSLMINFTKLEESDSTGDSYYVVGGRAYFEADVLGNYVTSFTSKGFFDKLGYVEPLADDNKDLILALEIAIPLAVVIIGGIITYCCCLQKKRKMPVHED